MLILQFLRKFPFLGAIVLGVLVLVVSLVAGSGMQNDEISAWNIIVWIAGILLGAGLGAALDQIGDSHSGAHSCALMFLFLVGLALFVFALILKCLYPEYNLWIEYCFTAGAASAGSSLSIWLAKLRRA